MRNYHSFYRRTCNQYRSNCPNHRLNMDARHAIDRILRDNLRNSLPSLIVWMRHYRSLSIVLLVITGDLLVVVGQIINLGNAHQIERERKSVRDQSSSTK